MFQVIREHFGRGKKAVYLHESNLGYQIVRNGRTTWYDKADEAIHNFNIQRSYHLRKGLRQVISTSRPTVDLRNVREQSMKSTLDWLEKARATVFM